TYASHNIPQSSWDGPAGEALVRVVQTGSTERVQNGTLQLADGREAQTLLAAPIVWRDQNAGALAAFVAGRDIRDDDMPSPKLRLRAATGYDTGTSEAPVDEADTVLATVLREKRAARGSLSELRTTPAWMPPRSANFLVTPIGALGVLVTARASGPYSEEDED